MFGFMRPLDIGNFLLGVQDTNEEVQKAIHRIQPFEQTRNVTMRPIQPVYR
jgi:coproporphyrinogen III oxidase-like Fe-S oxidoreductase